jgi:ankyrin repeat protein
MNSLLNAIQSEDLIQVEALISTRSIDINAQLSARHAPPPLALAAGHGFATIVDALLRAGAQIDSTDIRGRTACHLAAEKGNVEIVARLLEHSPDLTRKDWDHATPLDIAIFCNHERIAIMLIEAGAPLENRDRLLCRAAVMSVDVVRALLKHGVVVSELRDVFESTPIHKAASGPFNPGLMSMLVDECGIDLNSRDSLGDTCCHVAAYTESDKQLRWFIEAGADCELVKRRRRNPIAQSVHVRLRRLCVVACCRRRQCTSNKQ